MGVARLAVGGELKSAMCPPQEAERLVELYRYEVLDTVPDKALDDLVQLAAYICHAPFAVRMRRLTIGSPIIRWLPETRISDSTAAPHLRRRRGFTSVP